MRYDPDEHMAPEAWNEAEEADKISAVQEYHRKHCIRLPNARVHAIIHVIVENQVAMGEEYIARSVLERLTSEGLTRHQAVHAIGSVVSAQLFEALKQPHGKQDLGAQYEDQLNRLTAESWRKQFGE